MHPHPGTTSVTERQWLRWTAFVLLVGGLLAFAHLGFFLYAAVVVLVLLAGSWAFAASGIRGVTATREVPTHEVELGEHVRVTLRVTNGKGSAIPWLYFEDRLDEGVDFEGASCGLRSFAARETKTVSYVIRFERRGFYRLGPTVLETSDPFGLVRRFKLASAPDFVTVLPRGVPLTKRWPLGQRPIHEVPRRRSFAEDTTRFVGVREFRLGDELKRIHWRATARTGRLQSRVYEPAVLEGTLIALDVDERAYPGLAGARTEAQAAAASWHVEHAITTAASLSDFVLAEGQAVGLIANGADAAERYPGEWSGVTFRRLETALGEAVGRRRITRRRPVEVLAGKGLRHGRFIRTALARLVPSSGLTLPEMLLLELPRLPRSLVVAVITPAISPELGLAIAAMKRCGLDVAVLWLAKPGEGWSAASKMPDGVPVHAVPDEKSLSNLGERRL